MKTLTGENVSLIGMVHVRALPGTPGNKLSVREICRIATEEARVLSDAGFDALLVENMHDVPYLKRHVGPEIVACMTTVTRAVRDVVDCPLGVQILAGANKEAIAVAQAAGTNFVRVEGFVFAHVADEGIIEADAGELLRYRRSIGAEKIKIFTDIKKKHASHAITGDISLGETAHTAEFFGSDALVITGPSTGSPVARGDLEDAIQYASLPLIIGSGTTPELLQDLWSLVQGFIIGSYLKQDGLWSNPLDNKRIALIMEAATALRDSSSK
jgi:membrane complex biogenesis BtpA family protein